MDLREVLESNAATIGSASAEVTLFLLKSTSSRAQLGWERRAARASKAPPTRCGGIMGSLPTPALGGPSFAPTLPALLNSVGAASAGSCTVKKVLARQRYFREDFNGTSAVPEFRATGKTLAIPILPSGAVSYLLAWFSAV
jgi:hypothetical protein